MPLRLNVKGKLRVLGAADILNILFWLRFHLKVLTYSWSEVVKQVTHNPKIKGLELASGTGSIDLD